MSTSFFVTCTMIVRMPDSDLSGQYNVLSTGHRFSSLTSGSTLFVHVRVCPWLANKPEVASSNLAGYIHEVAGHSSALFF